MNNEVALQRISDPRVPATIEDYKELGNQVERIVGTITDTIGNVATTTARICELQANVKLECARMEYMLDALLAKAERDITIYEKSLPTLDKQFDKCQNRLDNLIDQSIAMLSGDISEASLKKQEFMMSLIEDATNMLNILISKLIPRY